MGYVKQLNFAGSHGNEIDCDKLEISGRVPFLEPRLADTAEIELQGSDDDVWGSSFKERH